MKREVFNRREVCMLSAATAALTFMSGAGALGASPPSADSSAVPPLLRRFIADYMQAMNAPGLTLAIAGRQGAPVTGCYGFVDLAAKTPVLPTHRFEIGSISKSFAALVILQLQDEGRLDVGQPILKYLPWLPIETDYGDILIHHLLTHSSGMPADAPAVPAELGARVRQTFQPGTQFHYSNWGFEVLGRLIEKLDGRPWHAALTSRILRPLGMSDTAPIISSSGRERIARSYVPQFDDRPFPRHGALVAAGNLTFQLASGSIASTPHDMGRYMQMLLNRGEGSSGRLVSQSAFKLFSSPHIVAPDFGPKVSYGYGIAVDQLDGHTRLRHTGGMVSFMSAIQLDLDAGVGAFASVNAQLGYRPNPVAQYALRLMQPGAGRKAQAPPAADETAVIASAADYAGSYRAPDGRTLEVIAEQGKLTLSADGERIAMQALKEDQFIAVHERFALFPLLFGRAPASASTSTSADAPAERGAVVELAYGPDWYGHARYSGNRNTAAVPELEPFVGKYYSENPWIGTVRIVQRRGQLWMDGVTPLARLGGDLFRLAEEPSSPETAEFRQVIDAKSQILSLGGNLLHRISAEEQI
jgi:CubicO group peptidase (beta-lactamase class C family)